MKSDKRRVYRLHVDGTVVRPHCGKTMITAVPAPGGYLGTFGLFKCRLDFLPLKLFQKEVLFYDDYLHNQPITIFRKRANSH